MARPINESSTQLRFSHSEQVPLRRPVGSDIVRFGRSRASLEAGCLYKSPLYSVAEQPFDAQQLL